MAGVMSRGKRGKRLVAEMNVVPYIDVTLVLLIIFMVTAPLVTQGVKVELPQAESEPVPPSDSEQVIVTIDAAGEIYINSEKESDAPVEADTLVSRLEVVKKYKPKTTFLVKGDQGVPYGRVVEVMALMNSAGIKDVGLLTDPPGKK